LILKSKGVKAGSQGVTNYIHSRDPDGVLPKRAPSRQIVPVLDMYRVAKEVYGACYFSVVEMLEVVGDSFPREPYSHEVFGTRPSS
jgi:hypothetical protein